VTSVATGAVYDRGYRPYDGRRGGRGTARAALLRLSVRRALGLRRSWRQKVFPWTLLAIATIPAMVNVGVGYLTRDSPIEDFEFFTHREYVGVSTALLLFVALTAPDVVCPDRRNRVLPLIFARPLTGADYVAAKVGAIALILFGFGFLPHVLLFVGQMLVSDDGALDHLVDNADVLWKVPVSVAVLSLHYACIGVALSATTGRRVVAGVAILALALVTSTVAGVVTEVEGGESAWALVNVLALPLHVRDLVFLGHVGGDGPLEGVAGAGAAACAELVVIVAVCLLYLRRRYREVVV
jgi:ABC-2 type transport system permease protein